MIETTQQKKKRTETKRIKKSSSHAGVSETTTNTSGMDELKGTLQLTICIMYIHYYSQDGGNAG